MRARNLTTMLIVIVGFSLLGFGLNPIHIAIESGISTVRIKQAKYVYSTGENSDFHLTPQAGTTWRVSESSNGKETNGGSFFPSISGDGRFISFMSGATNLVGKDMNGTTDVFVKDQITGVVELVSISSDEEKGNGESLLSSISTNGRFVAFASAADNLVSGDTNGTRDIFVRDRLAGLTTRVSVSTAGEQGNDHSNSPKISANGRYIVFSSHASNLVVGDPNGSEDIFYHDRETGITELASVANDGSQGNGLIWGHSISPEGRYVAFAPQSSFVPDDANPYYDVYVRDMKSKETELVSTASDGSAGNGTSSRPSISAGGRYVVFQSQATNLVSDDSTEWDDIFLHDRLTGYTERVSVTSDGTQVNSSSDFPSISGNGLFIAFRSQATDLVDNDTNGAPDIFGHDLLTGITERISVASDGSEANDYSSWDCPVSNDGRYVAFSSIASNLVPVDMNGVQDIFLRDRDTFSSVGIYFIPLIGGN